MPKHSGLSYLGLKDLSPTNKKYSTSSWLQSCCRFFACSCRDEKEIVEAPTPKALDDESEAEEQFIYLDRETSPRNERR